jgi:hypothetical protein
MICMYFPGTPALHRHSEMVYAVDRDRLVESGWRVFEGVGCVVPDVPLGYDPENGVFEVLDLTTRGE